DEAAAPPAAPGKPAPSSKLEPTWMMAERTVTVSSPEIDVAAGQSLTMHITSEEGRQAFVPAKDDGIQPVGLVALPDADGKAATAQVLKPMNEIAGNDEGDKPSLSRSKGSERSNDRGGGVA